MVTAYSPQWFCGIDSIFETISIVVCFLIFYYSAKAYKLTSEKKYLYFSLGFLSIAFSFIIKIITDLALNFKILHKSSPGLVLYLREISVTYTVGYFSFRFFALLGLTILLVLSLKIKRKRTISLLVLFAFISTILSTYNVLFFHLVSAVLLAYIFAYFYENYEKKKTNNSLMVALSFLVILISQLIFIFLVMNHALYVLGEIIQLIGYLILLFAYFMVLKK